MALTAQRALLTTLLVGGAVMLIDRVTNAPPGPPVPSRTVPVGSALPADPSVTPLASESPPPPIVSTPSDVHHAAPAPRPIAYALTGTSLSKGGTIGFLREIGGDRTWSVRKGDRVDDAIVVDVASDHVTLARGTGQQVVALGDAPATRAATIPQPATSDTPRLVGGEAADGDSGTDDVPVVPVPQLAAPMPPRTSGPAATLNSVDPPFDPAHQKGESANADDGSD